MAFPCNQFGAQEPWPEAQIKEWVTSNYGVEFPLLAKVDVKDENAAPIYQNLTQQAPDSAIAWNFAKYLVNGEGQVVKFYAHGVDPNDMMVDIEPLLNQQ